METKTKKGNIAIVAIIVAVVIIVAGIIGWILSQSTDEITNWKTYTNQKLGFELKYPANWFAVENDNEKRIYFQNLPGDSLKKPYPNNLRMVWISYDKDESNESNFLVEASANLKKYQINVDGISIMNVYEDSLPETGEVFTDAFWRYGDQLYSASTLGGEFATANIAIKAETEQNKVLNEMLSTLKFIK